MDYILDCMTIFIKAGIGFFFWILVICIFSFIIGILLSIFQRDKVVVGKMWKFEEWKPYFGSGIRTNLQKGNGEDKEEKDKTIH